jgi:hypothetical protein
MMQRERPDLGGRVDIERRTISSHDDRVIPPKVCILVSANRVCSERPQASPRMRQNVLRATTTSTLERNRRPLSAADSMPHRTPRKKVRAASSQARSFM